MKPSAHPRVYRVESLSFAPAYPCRYASKTINPINGLLYVDASTYHLVTFDMPANEVRISAVVSGVESVLLTAQMFLEWYSFNPANPARPGECDAVV